MNPIGIPAVRSPLCPVLLLLAAALAPSMLLGGCAARTLPPSEAPPLTLIFLPEPGDYISPQGEKLGLEQVVDLARDFDYVLIGENHKNACDHNIQQQIVAALSLEPDPPALGLEMVAVDMNPVLRAFETGEFPLEELEERLKWSERWGYPFVLFRPLFAIAQERGLPVAGLNLPKPVLDKARKDGEEALTDEEKAMYPSRVIPPDPEQSAMLEAAYGMHEGLAGHLTEFFHSQAVWDSMMAEQALALRQRTERQVVVIAGSGHVEHGWGIAHRLASLDPGASVLLLDGYRDGDLNATAADAFFYCPPRFDSKLGMSLEVRQNRVLVVRVERGSRADLSGLRPGDVLLEVQGREMESFKDLHVAGKQAHDQDQPLVMTVERANGLGRSVIDIDFGKLGQGPTEERP